MVSAPALVDRMMEGGRPQHDTADGVDPVGMKAASAGRRISP
ncbi:hypothetical protein [Nonomuraea sp. B5E05]